jgi:hypothetical protein
MNSPLSKFSNIDVSKNLNTTINFWSGLYKVYANIELIKLSGKVYVEVIDGYLKDGEMLIISNPNILKKVNTNILILEVINKSKKNTYFKSSPLNFNVQESNKWLVCIKRDNKLIGYQYLDSDNNLLGEPNFELTDFK